MPGCNGKRRQNASSAGVARIEGTRHIRTFLGPTRPWREYYEKSHPDILPTELKTDGTHPAVTAMDVWPGPRLSNAGRYFPRRSSGMLGMTEQLDEWS